MEPYRFSVAGGSASADFSGTASIHTTCEPDPVCPDQLYNLLFIDMSFPENGVSWTDVTDKPPKGIPISLYHGFRTLPERTFLVPICPYIQRTTGISVLFCKFLL